MKTLEILLTIKAKLDAPIVWATLPEKHCETKERIAAAIAKVELEPSLQNPDNLNPVPLTEINSGPVVEIINVSGELIKGGGIDYDICEMFGVCDTDNLAAQLRAAGEDPNVLFVMMNFDSPGGDALGLANIASLIRDIGEKKAVIGFCSSVCASGGFWLASQCSMFFVTKDCTLGGVGCFRERVDLTKQLEKDGVAVHLVKDGAYKTFGHPAEPYSDKEEQMLQERVNEVASNFRRDVQTNRKIDSQYLQGQVFSGEKAVDPTINLADANFDDLNDLLTFLASSTYLYTE